MTDILAKLTKEKSLLDLEDQVCSLEGSKEFLKFDLPRGSFFCWVQNSVKSTWKVFPRQELYSISSKWDILNAVPAYTVAEMGVLLPCDGSVEVDCFPDQLSFETWDKKILQFVSFTALGRTEVLARENLLLRLLKKGRLIYKEGRRVE